MFEGNVFPKAVPLTKSSYRAVVASIIQSIRDETGHDWELISDHIGCCEETVENAIGQKGDLSPVYMLRLGLHYGAQRLQPLASLIGARISSRGHSDFAETDVALAISRAMVVVTQALPKGGMKDDDLVRNAAEIDALWCAADQLRGRLDELRARREAA